jgi:UDPglucose 6-dehydrogenase
MLIIKCDYCLKLYFMNSNIKHMVKIMIIGLGFVGGAMYTCFQEKGFVENVNLFGYDKYNGQKGTGKLEDVLECDIAFLALPTTYSINDCKYDISALHEICGKLVDMKYLGAVVIKSTIEPGTCEKLSNKYQSLSLIHNPEFLTARTALKDFTEQKHIVIGTSDKCNKENLDKVINFYKTYFPNAEISTSTSSESESMKIYLNCFYAVKVQFFTELYSLCDSTNCNFKNIVNLMIKNGWINPMHTNVPGPDGQISYGGLCFPKDTNALLMYMKKNNSPCAILEATIEERNSMRDDNDNCK